MSLKDGHEKNLTKKKELLVSVKKKIALKPNSFAEAVLGIKRKAFDDVVRVKVGEEEIKERKVKLVCCLVGQWRGGLLLLDTKTLKRRMWFAWDLKGNLNVVDLGKGMWIFEFDSKKEADRILRVGSRNLGNFSIALEKWS